MCGWMEVKAVLRIAYSKKKILLAHKLSIFVGRLGSLQILKNFCSRLLNY